MKIDLLMGKTFTEIRGGVGSGEIDFVKPDGSIVRMYHEQDCCEGVEVQDICGDLSDLIGTPIVQADEETNSASHPEGVTHEYEPESFTWTFYRLSTIKGSVVIRWLGTSNGCYGEGVTVMEIHSV